MIALLTVLAFALRLAGLMTTSEPVGLDGYYYVVQAETWLAHGTLHAPDPSWVLRAIALVCGAAGDPVLGVKIAAAALAALCVPAAAFCVWAARGSPVLGAAWALASPAIAHLCGEHPKNLGATAPLLVSVGALLLAKGDKRWLVLAAFAALLAAGAHKSAAAILLIITVELGLRRMRYGWIVGVAVVLAAMAGALRPSDVARVDFAFVPWPLHPFRYLEARPMPVVEVIELCTPWLALLTRAPVVLLSTLVLLPIWRTDVVDLGFRLALFVPIIVTPLLIARMRWRVASLALVLAAWPIELAVRAHDVTPPYQAYRSIIAQLPRPPLLIAHAGFNFLYHHETGHEAMAWAPEPSLDPTQVGRLVHGISAREWEAYLPGDPPLALGGAYSYWREDHFQRLLAAIEDVENDDLKDRLSSDLNPRRVRPAFLQRAH